VCQGARGKGQPIKVILLKGITGDTVNAKRPDVAFPVTTIEDKRYAIFMRNQTLVVDKETETLFRATTYGVCLCGVIRYVTLMMKRLLSTEIL
jgi:hypothetical protein